VTVLSLIGRSLSWAVAAAVVAVPFASPGGPLSLVPIDFTQPAPLTIAGDIAGLRAHQPGRLTLTLRSSGSEAVVVTAVTVRVAAAPQGCPSGALSVGGWTGRVTVPGQGSTAVSVPVTLQAADAACLGGTWKLTYAST
jgi:hypothetical protein